MLTLPAALFAGCMLEDEQSGLQDLVAEVTVPSYADEFVLLVGSASGHLMYMPSYGDGTFATPTLMTDIGYRAGAGIGDFDGDGDLDFVAGATRDSPHNIADFYYFENLGAGNFAQRTLDTGVPAGYRSDNMVTRLAVADYDNDGDMDFVAPIYRSSNVYLYSNNGAGTFTRSTLPPLADPVDAAPGDFNEDGNMDFLLVDYFQHRLFLYEGNGQGGFSSHLVTTLSSPRALWVATGDLDEDDNLDFIFTEHSRMHQFRGNGTGQFVLAGTEQTPNMLSYSLYDFDKDGHQDRIGSVYNGSARGTVSFQRGNGDGTFQATQVIATGQSYNSYGFIPVAPSNAAAPDNTAPVVTILSPVAGAVVNSAVQVTVHVDDANFAAVECTLDGGNSLGESSDPDFTQLVTTLDLLDGSHHLTCVATDQAGNTGQATTTFTVRNWLLDLKPETLNLRSQGGNRSVTEHIEGVNVGLLLPVAAHEITLRVPGGASAALTPYPGSLSVSDSDGDGVPELTLKFDRQALIAGIRAGITAGTIDPAQPLVVQTYVGEHAVGQDVMKLVY